MKLNITLSILSKAPVSFFLLILSSESQKYTIIFEKVKKIESCSTFSDFMKGIFKNKEYISEEAFNFKK